MIEVTLAIRSAFNGSWNSTTPRITEPISPATEALAAESRSYKSLWMGR